MEDKLINLENTLNELIEDILINSTSDKELTKTQTQLKEITFAINSLKRKSIEVPTELYQIQNKLNEDLPIYLRKDALNSIKLILDKAQKKLKRYTNSEEYVNKMRPVNKDKRLIYLVEKLNPASDLKIYCTYGDNQYKAYITQDATLYTDVLDNKFQSNSLHQLSSYLFKSHGNVWSLWNTTHNGISISLNDLLIELEYEEL